VRGIATQLITESLILSESKMKSNHFATQNSFWMTHRLRIIKIRLDKFKDGLNGNNAVH